MAIINDQQAPQLAELIDQPQQAQRTFWTAKAFHGCINKEYQIQCSYETVVRFFHKQGYALKTPQPWPDKQLERLDQAIFGVINNPKKIQKTACIGTLLRQTL